MHQANAIQVTYARRCHNLMGRGPTPPNRPYLAMKSLMAIRGRGQFVKRRRSLDRIQLGAGARTRPSKSGIACQAASRRDSAWLDLTVPARYAHMPFGRYPRTRKPPRRSLVVGAICLHPCPPVRHYAPGSRAKLEPKKDVTLTADDGMVSEATFWPGTRARRACRSSCCTVMAATVRNFNALAELLARAGCAVISTDLRGHGESTQMQDTTGIVWPLTCRRPRSPA